MVQVGWRQPPAIRYNQNRNNINTSQEGHTLPDTTNTTTNDDAEENQQDNASLWDLVNQLDQALEHLRVW